MPGSRVKTCQWLHRDIALISGSSGILVGALAVRERFAAENVVHEPSHGTLPFVVSGYPRLPPQPRKK